MSLFKICDWWSAQCTDVDENYDSFSIITTRFGLKENEKDYVVVGSHSGHLSIFYPNANGKTTKDNENNNINIFKAVDLLLECKFDFPILMLRSGKFSNNQQNVNQIQLAVLHPNSLIIYNISNLEGLIEHGSQYTLQKFTEYNFELSAFSFCTGNFGQIKGRDFICIVHLNGSLSFYEQDGISYSCNLEGLKSIPSIILYNPRTDSFITMNSFWDLECYSYQDISHSGMNSNTVQPAWCVILGEYALDIDVIQTEKDNSSIIILGERNLINVSDNGVINFILKLDFVPKCFHSFLVGYYWDNENKARLITTIVSENSTILIYENNKLLWAAQHENSKVVIKRGVFEDLSGGIVTLSANGFLSIGYLGSEPFIFQVPQLNVQELNFDASHKELSMLENEIKTTIDTDDVKFINTQTENDLDIIEFSISPNMQPNTFETADDELSGKQLMMCPGFLKFCNRIPIEEIQVLFNVPSGISCSYACQTFTNVLENRTESIENWFYINEKLCFSSTKVEVIISFITKQGVPRIVKKNSHLPLTMFYKMVPGQKEASIKLTAKISANPKAEKKQPKHLPPLIDIFPEFLKKESSDDKSDFGDTRVFGLSSILWPNKIVTLVPAKGSNRLRIQSNHIEAISPILERIENYFCNEDNFNSDIVSPRQKALNISTTGSQVMPFDDVITKIDNHNTIQQNIMNQTLKMDSLWQQFKLFQRSLQSKKDDNQVDGILMLIEKNYDDLVMEGDKLIELRNAEKLNRNVLDCSIALIKRIVNTFKIDERVLNLLRSVFVTRIEDWSEYSWEESISPGIEAIKNLIVSKSSESATTVLISTPERFDFETFKGNLMFVFKRIFEIENKDKGQGDAEAS